MDLTGKVAIVTGSGRGIGREIALRLAQAGADVTVCDIGNPIPAEETSEEIKKLGRKSLVVMGNVSIAEDVTQIVDTTVTTWGRVDILVNNAGITRDTLAMRMTEEEWDNVITVNLKSVFLCSRAVIKYMVKQRCGRIISLSSIIGIIGNAGQGNYAASKAGIIGFTRSIAKEVASRNITVNAIAPGFIDTAMTRALPEERRKDIVSRIPAGCFGTPRDIAETVAFLASDEARYITGQVITVDGGLSLGKI